MHVPWTTDLEILIALTIITGAGRVGDSLLGSVGTYRQEHGETVHPI